MSRIRSVTSLGRGLSGDSEKMVLRTIGFTLLLMVLACAWIIKEGMWGKLWHITWSNFPIWVVLGGITAYGLWWKRKGKEAFTWEEFGLYWLLMWLYCYPVMALGYYHLTDLGDTEFLNSHAKTAEYTPQYYKETTDDDGKVTRDYYGPYYIVYTHNVDGWGSAESINVTEGAYERFVAHWGGSSKVKSRVNWDASHLAFIHSIDWDGRNETAVPTAKEHAYVNYVRASSSILKVRGSMKGYDKLLLPYPKVQVCEFGRIRVHRVLEAGVNLAPGVKDQLTARLDDHLRLLGKEKQVNILVYVVGSDPAFFPALQEYWALGKKNDCVVVIGSPDGTQIEWVRVMAYTDHHLFKEKMEADVRDLRTLNNGVTIADTIVNRIKADGDGGYVRKPMADYAYLVGDIDLPTWALILVMLVVAGLMSPLAYWLVHN